MNSKVIKGNKADIGVRGIVLDGFILPNGYHKNSGITNSPGGPPVFSDVNGRKANKAVQSVLLILFGHFGSSLSIRRSDFAGRPDWPVLYRRVFTVC